MYVMAWIAWAWKGCFRHHLSPPGITSAVGDTVREVGGGSVPADQEHNVVCEGGGWSWSYNKDPRGGELPSAHEMYKSIKGPHAT